LHRGTGTDPEGSGSGCGYKQRRSEKYRTLAEALRGVPGFFVDRNELKERIYLRGIPDSFLVMMDGVPFSSDASTIDYPRGADLSLDYL